MTSRKIKIFTINSLNIYKIGEEFFICDSVIYKPPQHKLLKCEVHGITESGEHEDLIIDPRDDVISIYKQPKKTRLVEEYYKFDQVIVRDGYLNISDLKIPDMEGVIFIPFNSTTKNKTYLNCGFRLRFEPKLQFELLTKKESKELFQ